MKFCAVALLALLYFNAVYAHTIMTQIIINDQGQTSCMRPQYPGNLYQYTSIGADFPISSSNLMSNGLTSNNYTCGFLPYAGRAASSKCTVAAGSKIGITYYHGGNYGNEDPVLDKCIARSHKGPFMAFLANSETGSGNVWFKIYQSGQINTYTGYDYEQVKWASPDEMLAKNCTFYFEIPSDIAPGNYLLRTEIIAMHDTSYHGAQPYVACTELSITGSGSARPAGVAIPGDWDYNHPGITYNIYDDFRTAYPFPGPAVYKAGSSATSASATSASATSAAAATSASATSASATSASATSAAATSYSATTGYGSTTGTFQRINVRVTIRVNLAPSSIDITYLVYEITQVLGIPSSALSDVTIDLDQSKSSGPTVIEFIIWNDLKADGTRVNPVDAALRLQTMASNQDPTLQSTSYLSGMQVIDQQTQTDETAASSSSGVSTTAIIAGAVVGGVVVVAGVAVGAYFIVKKKNNGGWM